MMLIISVPICTTELQITSLKTAGRVILTLDAQNAQNAQYYVKIKLVIIITDVKVYHRFDADSFEHWLMKVVEHLY